MPSFDEEFARLGREAEPAGVHGLVGVRSGNIYYAGKLDTDAMGITWTVRPTAEDHFRLLRETGGYVALKEAWELLVQFGADPSTGELAVRVLPVPAAPFPRGHLTSIVVHATGGIVDLSGEAGLAPYHRAMTARTGVLIPGGVVAR